MPRSGRNHSLRRKDLRLPDEFETVVGRISSWARRNTPLVVGVGGAVLTVGLIVFLLQNARQGRAVAATTAFRSAQSSLQGGRLDDAVAAFALITEEYPGTPSGQLASLYRGHALARKGDATAAATAYEGYLSDGSDPSYLRQEALLGLGYARQAAGDTAAAIEALTQAGAAEGPYRIDALLAAGRIQEATGDRERARTTYEEALNLTTDPDLRAFLRPKAAPAP